MPAAGRAVIQARGAPPVVLRGLPWPCGAGAAAAGGRALAGPLGRRLSAARSSISNRPFANQRASASIRLGAALVAAGVQGPHALPAAPLVLHSGGCAREVAMLIDEAGGLAVLAALDQWFTEPSERAAIDAWVGLSAADQQTCINFLGRVGRHSAPYRLWAAGRLSAPPGETVPLWRGAVDAIKRRDERATLALRSGSFFLSFRRKGVGAVRESLAVDAWRDLCLIEELNHPKCVAYQSPTDYPREYQAGYPMQPIAVTRDPSAPLSTVRVLPEKHGLRWELRREWRANSVLLHRGAPAPERELTPAARAARDARAWMLGRMSDLKSNGVDPWPRREDWRRDAKPQFRELTNADFDRIWDEAAEAHPHIKSRGRPPGRKKPGE